MARKVKDDKSVIFMLVTVAALLMLVQCSTISDASDSVPEPSICDDPATASVPSATRVWGNAGFCIQDSAVAARNDCINIGLGDSLISYECDEANTGTLNCGWLKEECKDG